MTDPLEDLPPRAQIGYVLKHGTVTHGKWTPGTVVGVLVGKGVDIQDTENMKRIAKSVMEQRGLIDDG